jgi:UrcA family protein
VKETIGRSSIGAPINAISLSYRVSYSALNLSTEEGSVALKSRVEAAALAACKEISSKYPDATPSDEECAVLAARDAMVKVREVVAGAGKAAQK